MAKYTFDAMVKGVRKMKDEAGEKADFLRVTLDDGKRLKVVMDGNEDRKVVMALRKGVNVKGTFDSVHGWIPEGQQFAQISTLINADILEVKKGNFAQADVEEGIDAVDWYAQQAEIQKTFVATGTETTTGAAPDMGALADALKSKPQQ